MDRRLVSANTRFGFQLSAEIVEQDAGKNVFVSPASVAIALAMTCNGAAGETQQAMAQVLGVAGAAGAGAGGDAGRAQGGRDDGHFRGGLQMSSRWMAPYSPTCRRPAAWGRARYAPDARPVSVGQITGYVVQQFGWWMLDWKVGDVGFEVRASVTALSLEELLTLATGVQPLE